MESAIDTYQKQEHIMAKKVTSPKAAKALLK
jgi:hypothetical protein